MILVIELPLGWMSNSYIISQYLVSEFILWIFIYKPTTFFALKLIKRMLWMLQRLVAFHIIQCPETVQLVRRFNHVLNEAVRRNKWQASNPEPTIRSESGGLAITTCFSPAVNDGACVWQLPCQGGLIAWSVLKISVARRDKKGWKQQRKKQRPFENVLLWEKCLIW